MQYKKNFKPFKNHYIKNLIGSVLYENALIFPKILKRSKKYVFLKKKLRYLKARIINKSFFGFRKRNYTFISCLTNKIKKNKPKVNAMHNLLVLALKVKQIGEKILKVFSNKFVGKEAQLLIKQYLNTYVSMYTFWYENEKWGFFDEDLTEKTKLKLIKYFWLNKTRRFLRFKLWKRAYPFNNFNFRYIKKFGYNIKSLKITDQLFFWHAFTRKKLKQTLWIFRTSQIFRKILCLKKKKSSGIYFKYKKNSLFFYKIYNFFLNLPLYLTVVPFCYCNLNFNCANKSLINFLQFKNFNLNFNKNQVINLTFILVKLKNIKINYYLKNIVLKSYFWFIILNFFFIQKVQKKKCSLYSNNSLALFLFFVTNKYKCYDKL